MQCALEDLSFWVVAANVLFSKICQKKGKRLVFIFSVEKVQNLANMSTSSNKLLGT